MSYTSYARNNSDVREDKFEPGLILQYHYDQSLPGYIVYDVNEDGDDTPCGVTGIIGYMATFATEEEVREYIKAYEYYLE